MKQFITDAFTGIDKSYYIRHFIFGIGISILFFALQEFKINSMVFFLIVSTFLYPYANLVYDNVMSFIIGDNEFRINIFLFMFLKFSRMLLLFGFSIFIAPIGFVYLAFYHNRNRKKLNNEA